MLDRDADEAAERAITRGLRRRFAGATIVGEEASERDPSLLSRIAGDALCFVVDPIDGTKNFSSGLPLFGSMVATVNGEVALAAIHDPVCGDIVRAARRSVRGGRTPGAAPATCASPPPCR